MEDDFKRTIKDFKTLKLIFSKVNFRRLSKTLRNFWENLFFQNGQKWKEFNFESFFYDLLEGISIILNLKLFLWVLNIQNRVNLSKLCTFCLLSAVMRKI